MVPSNTHRSPPEYLDVAASLAQLDSLPDLEDLPVHVLARGVEVWSVNGSAERGLPANEPLPALLGTQDEWASLQADLRNLSARSELTTLADAGHMVEVDRPDAIADAVAQIMSTSG